MSTIFWLWSVALSWIPLRLNPQLAKHGVLRITWIKWGRTGIGCMPRQKGMIDLWHLRAICVFILWFFFSYQRFNSLTCTHVMFHDTFTRLHPMVMAWDGNTQLSFHSPEGNSVSPLLFPSKDTQDWLSKTENEANFVNLTVQMSSQYSFLHLSCVKPWPKNNIWWTLPRFYNSNTRFGHSMAGFCNTEYLGMKTAPPNVGRIFTETSCETSTGQIFPPTCTRPVPLEELPFLVVLLIGWISFSLQIQSASRAPVQAVQRHVSFSLWALLPSSYCATQGEGSCSAVKLSFTSAFIHFYCSSLSPAITDPNNFYHVTFCCTLSVIIDEKILYGFHLIVIK